MTPQFRFTFFHDVLSPSGTVVAQPVGWKDCILKLERDPSWFSLIEYFDGSFIWYGSARDFIINAESIYGVDVRIRLLIELTFDGTYETVFDGQLDISQIEEQAKGPRFYKSTIPIIRDDMWATFMNRKDTPVNLKATTDLDGNARTAPSLLSLSLTSQLLHQVYEGFNNADVDYGTGGELYFNIGWNVSARDEIEVRNDNGSSVETTLPDPLFNIAANGDYVFNINVQGYYTWSGAPFIGGLGDYYSCVIRINDTEFTFTATAFPGDLTNFAYSATHTLAIGDRVRIYFKRGGSGLPAGFHAHMVQASNTITVEADTSVPTSVVPVFKLFEAGKSILNRIIGTDDSLVSDFLQSGCGKNNAIIKGINIRGYNLTARPMFLSFQDYWDGANPILNLGLGYTDGGQIEIEDKAAFFDSVPAVNFDYVTDISRTYNQDYIFKLIEIGYEVWAAESDTGTDDTQSKRSFNTRFSQVGTDLSLMSKFVGASIAWEKTKRLSIVSGQDWRLDENTFIVALNQSDNSVPELDEAFSSITDLINSATRYNTRLSATRNFYRWLNFLSGCLQTPSGQKFHFAGGEGNVIMESVLTSSACGEPLDVVENADVDASVDYLFEPRAYSFNVPMTWDTYKLIRTNRKKAIGVSQTNVSHVPYYILDLQYKLVKGFAEVVALKGKP